MKPGVSKDWARWGPLAQGIQSRQQDAHEGRHGDFDGGGRSSGAAFYPPLYAATALEAAARGKPFFNISL